MIGISSVSVWELKHCGYEMGFSGNFLATVL